MTLIVEVDKDDPSKLYITPEVELTLKDRFEFQEAYTKSGEHITGYVVDLSRVTYIDSSGLGLKAYAEQSNAYFEVKNLGEFLRGLLHIPEIDSLFGHKNKKE